jgi:hypothetical protein
MSTRRHGAVGVESGELMRGWGWESSEAMDVQIVDFDGKISRTLHQRIVLQLVSLSLMSRDKCRANIFPSNWSSNGLRLREERQRGVVVVTSPK